MVTKAKKKEPAAEPATNGHKPDVTQTTDNFEFILTGSLIPSPTNPRKRFDDKSLAELAESIKTVGILEPLLVRRSEPPPAKLAGTPLYMHEIVCGERRARAAELAELETVPAIIRDLTDEQVLDIQIHENLHREDVHPMDEAYGYKFLQEKLGCNVTELALRVGKSEKYILNRLKLNTLIKEAQEDVDAGYLPLVYALEIAKHPAEAQELILNKGAYHQNSEYNSKTQEWDYEPDRARLNRFTDFKEWIEEKILLRLSSAPFDKKSATLRKDGLTCIACPDRSGVNQGLFDEGLSGKKDCCLNPVWWNGKTVAHVGELYLGLAEKQGITTDMSCPDDFEEFRKHITTISLTKASAPVGSCSAGSLTKLALTLTKCAKNTTKCLDTCLSRKRNDSREFLRKISSRRKDNGK